MINFNDRNTRFSLLDGYIGEKEKGKNSLAPLGDSNIICSDMVDHDGLHMPVIDLDVPAYLLPSSTKGHSHLYIDVPVSADKYMELLHLLADMGIVERGYANVSEKKGYSSVRLPWVKKIDPPEVIPSLPEVKKIDPPEVIPSPLPF